MDARVTQRCAQRVTEGRNERNCDLGGGRGRIDWKDPRVSLLRPP